ncbi:hypothetical protein C8Q78DRAFT_1063237 [Trametes maxima]|nr:hypothetical protein C8Q78DRAFT_1063237 [Trametes maxima]
MPEMRLDYRQIIGKDMGLDLLLPNMRHPGVAHDHTWRFSMLFDKRHWHFRGDRRALGDDMKGRMLRFGTSFSGDHAWLAFVPKGVLRRPPHVSDVKVGQQPTTMDPVMARVVSAGLLHVMSKAEYGDVRLRDPYPDVSSDDAFCVTWDIRERSRYEFNLDEMQKLCHAFKREWAEWYKGSPKSYRFAELDDSVPIVLTILYGQDALLGGEDTAEADSQIWLRERDWSLVGRMAMAFACHYTCSIVEEWEEVPIARILANHREVYDSPMTDARNRIEDLAAVLLLGEDGREVPIYTRDGVYIQRRRPARTLRRNRCSIMQNLSATPGLFAATAGDESEDEVEEELDEGYAIGIDEADYELNLDHARAAFLAKRPSYTVYPHFFSKTVGQWQSTGVMAPLVPYLRDLSRTVSARGSGGHAIQPLKSQCYNTVAHRMRHSARFHLAQRGILTAAAAGPWATSPSAKHTAERLQQKIERGGFPHETLAHQLTGGDRDYLRHEMNILVDFRHLRPELKAGDALYHAVIMGYRKIARRADVMDHLRKTSVIFRRGVFPDIYLWASWPIVSLVETTWNSRIRPHFMHAQAAAGQGLGSSQGTVVASSSQLSTGSDAVGRTRAQTKPDPVYVEWIGVLERILNYALTGHAKVLPRRLMHEIWASRGLLEHGFPTFWPGLTLGGESMSCPEIQLRHWPLDPKTKRPLTASKRSQEITYGSPQYLSYETLFYMRTAIAHTNYQRWRDASTLGREERVLADIAIRAYVEDVITLVDKQLWAEIKPALDARDGDDYQEALRRQNAFKVWRALEYPLDWGDYSLTCTTITKMVSATQAEAAARGLPKSAKGQWSVADFVAHLFHIGVTMGLNAIRPPVWNRGAFWPILRAAVTEGMRRAQATGLSAQAAEEEVKHAFVYVVNEMRIRIIPDALPPPPDSRRPSLEPSIHAWTTLGAKPRAVVSGRSAPPTQREEVEFQISQRSVEDMQQDSSSDWDSTEVSIGEYHSYLGRTTLPSNWRVPASKPGEADTFTTGAYEWAEEQFRHKLTDWRVDLALHLAYLISKVTPRVAWPSNGTALLESELNARGVIDSGHKPLKELSGEKARAAIAAVRKLPWTERKAKGSQAESLYFTQASVVFLCWMHEASPLRERMKKVEGTLGNAWTKKHGSKSLSPVNLARMGIAYPLSAGIVGRPLYMSNFRVLPEKELSRWHKRVVSLLRQTPHRPYILVEEVFGAAITDMLFERGHFPQTASLPRVPENAKRTMVGDGESESEEWSARPVARQKMY